MPGSMQMKEYDQYREIDEIFRILSEEEKTGRRRIIPDRNQSPEQLKRPSIVLRSETAIEIGGPGTESFCCLAGTEVLDAVPDQELMVVGPDIGDLLPGTYVCGIFILAEGADWTLEDYYRLAEYTLPPGILEEVMVKHSHDGIWLRISHRALEKGISCSVFGDKITGLIKQQFPKVRHVCLVISFSRNAGMKRFHEIAEHIRDTQKKIRKAVWQERGIDITACSPGMHCNACKNQSTCTEVKKITEEYREIREAKNGG